MKIEMDTQKLETSRLFKIAFYQALFLVVYNTVEGIVSSILGYKDESLTLFGFGVDSFIEVISGLGILQMITRIQRNPDSNRGNYERTALKMTGVAFYILVAGLIITSIYNIVSGHKPEATFFGIIISCISIVVMGLFVHFQTRVGKALNSAAILADVQCTKVCIYMSIVLLIGSILYHFFSLPYVDSVGALVLAYFSYKEGRECFEKANNNKICCSD